MENYYFDLSRLPEKFNNESALKFLKDHNLNVFNVLDAPKNKHIGSGAWHDDVIAFLEANIQVSPEIATPVAPALEVVDKSVQKETLAELIKTDEEHGMYDEQLLPASTDQELSDTMVSAEPKKKKAAKKSEDSPKSTDNGVA